MHMTTTTRVGGVTIVDISGRIVLGEESAALWDLVCDLLSKGHKKILLNQLRIGPSGQCFHPRAEAGGGDEAAQPHE
jgi:hypothetical protein